MNSSVAEQTPLLWGLPPIVDARSRVLILGSFPSEASLRARKYYAHPRNNFWPIFEELFGIDRRGSYEERVAGLIENRIAVWDVIGSCRRMGSADQAIQDAQPNDLMGWLGEHQRVRGIAFNGTKAEDTARKSVPLLFTKQEVMARRFPSTSPANASISLVSKVAAWAQIKEWAHDDA
jgi:hypoxanthine-DNA glycosylase